MNQQNIKQYWENRAKCPKFLWSNMTGINCHIIEELLLYRKLNKIDILDLGAGDCTIAKFLSEKGHNVTAVDYIEKYIKLLPKNMLGICSDINDFNINKTFDVILMFGVVVYLDDGSLKNLISKLKNMLNDHGIVILKHQCSKSEEDVVINKFSEDLQDNYIAKYRAISKELKLYKQIGDVEISNPHSQFNRWPETFWKMFIITKN